MQVEKEIKPGSDVVMSETSMKRNYTPYSDQDKVRFFKLLFERCLSATAVAKRLGIHARTAQIWVEQYEKDPNCIFEKQRKTNRPGILNEKHKKVILVCIDTNPSVVLNDTMENLRHKFYEKLCLDESAFHFNLKGSPAVVTVPKIRAKAAILCVISAQGLIECSPRLPQPLLNKKRK
ncbi:hypothetical protein RMCBS344292_07991 [Rhizopus microsporus]|nr:hypothetical protein RMCBS344292_07991 [Rhizopus microsporus]